jgi:hypothetical protein
MAKDTQAPSISVRLMDYPEYAAAHAKLIELQQARDNIEARAREIEIMLTGLADAETFETIDTRSPIRREAEDLLVGKEEASQTSDKDLLRKNLSQVRRTLYAHRDAVGLAEQRLNTIRYKVSKDICSKLKPQYDQLVRNIGTAMIALNGAMVAEREFFERLFLADVANGELIAMPIPRLGTLKQQSSIMTAYFGELLERGIITAEEAKKAGLHPDIVAMKIKSKAA